MQLMTPAAPTAVDSALERDAAALHRALSELVRAYQFRDREQICCHDISVSQCYALEALVRRGPLTLNEVAAQLFLEKSTASRMVDGLEAKGYLTRAPHPADRRALQLAVTPAGRALYERIEAELVEQEMQLLSRFQPEVRQALARLLGQLAEAAVSRLGGSCCNLD